MPEDVNNQGLATPAVELTSPEQKPVDTNVPAPEGGVKTEGQQVPKARFDEIIAERNRLREEITKSQNVPQPQPAQENLGMDLEDENVKRGLKFLDERIDVKTAPLRDKLSLYEAAMTDQTFSQNLDEIKKLAGNPEYASYPWNVLNDIAKGRKADQIISQKTQEIQTQIQTEMDKKKQQEGLPATAGGASEQIETAGELKPEDFRPVFAGGKSKEELARLIGRAK